MVNFNKVLAYGRFIEDIQACKKCKNVDTSMCLLGRLNGPLNSRIMFVGTAPGKKVEGVEQKPFSVGPSTENFEFFLKSSKIERSDVYITNAVLHIPLTNGLHRNPNDEEILNCNEHLQRQIEIIDPVIVVALGALALKALGYIKKHDLRTSRDAGCYERWNDRYLFALFHPSPTVTPSIRSYEDQIDDYKALKKLSQQLRKKELIREIYIK